MVKRVVPDYPANKEELEVIGLKDGDRIVGASELRTGDEDLVFITSDAQLLRYPAAQVRQQAALPGYGGCEADGRGAGALVRGCGSRRGGRGVHGGWVARHAGRFGTDLEAHTVRPVSAQGQGHRRVRCQRFLKGEDVLVFAWAGGAPARAAQKNGTPAQLPEPDPRRDGSGTPVTSQVAVVAGPV
ncbi:hypothetical protein NKH18_37980 [Streptomyces sp. M10(2022)]